MFAPGPTIEDWRYEEEARILRGLARDVAPKVQGSHEDLLGHRHNTVVRFCLGTTQNSHRSPIVGRIGSNSSPGTRTVLTLPLMTRG